MSLPYVPFRWVNQVDFIPFLGQPARVPARASADVEDNAGWLGEKPTYELLHAGELQESTPSPEPACLIESLVVREDLALVGCDSVFGHQAVSSPLLRRNPSQGGKGEQFLDANGRVLIESTELLAQGVGVVRPPSVRGYGRRAVGEAADRLQVSPVWVGAGQRAIFKGGHGYQRDQKYRQCQEDTACDKEPPLPSWSETCSPTLALRN